MYRTLELKGMQREIFSREYKDTKKAIALLTWKGRPNFPSENS